MHWYILIYSNAVKSFFELRQEIYKYGPYRTILDVKWNEDEVVHHIIESYYNRNRHVTYIIDGGDSQSDKSKIETLNHQFARQLDYIERESSINSRVMLAGAGNSIFATLSAIVSIALFLWAAYRVLSICNGPNKEQALLSYCCGCILSVGNSVFRRGPFLYSKSYNNNPKDIV